jgi:hypothetical protein
MKHNKIIAKLISKSPAIAKNTALPANGLDPSPDELDLDFYLHAPLDESTVEDDTSIPLELQTPAFGNKHGVHNSPLFPRSSAHILQQSIGRGTRKRPGTEAKELVKDVRRIIDQLVQGFGRYKGFSIAHSVSNGTANLNVLAHEARELHEVLKKLKTEGSEVTINESGKLSATIRTPEIDPTIFDSFSFGTNELTMAPLGFRGFTENTVPMLLEDIGDLTETLRLRIGSNKLNKLVAAIYDGKKVKLSRFPKEATLLQFKIEQLEQANREPESNIEQYEGPDLESFIRLSIGASPFDQPGVHDIAQQVKVYLGHASKRSDLELMFSKGESTGLESLKGMDLGATKSTGKMVIPFSEKQTRVSSDTQNLALEHALQKIAPFITKQSGRPHILLGKETLTITLPNKSDLANFMKESGNLIMWTLAMGAIETYKKDDYTITYQTDAGQSMIEGDALKLFRGIPVGTTLSTGAIITPTTIGGVHGATVENPGLLPTG